MMLFRCSSRVYFINHCLCVCEAHNKKVEYSRERKTAGAFGKYTLCIILPNKQTTYLYKVNNAIYRYVPWGITVHFAFDKDDVVFGKIIWQACFISDALVEEKNKIHNCCVCITTTTDNNRGNNNNNKGNNNNNNNVKKEQNTDLSIAFTIHCGGLELSC